MVKGQPVITVRFANPVYDCATQNYTVDAEFQTNTPDQKIYSMNVRFVYDENVLEFESFSDLKTGYAVAPNSYSKWVSPTIMGDSLFDFTGPYELIQATIKKDFPSASDTISTIGWTRLFKVSLHVDDPFAYQNPNFCPSLIWDRKENAQVGMSTPQGIVIIFGTKYSQIQTTEYANQHNWVYDGTPEVYPYGYPEPTNCSPFCALAPTTYLPDAELVTPDMVSIPVTVEDFTDITSFSLAFEYDHDVMSYAGHTPNSVFNGLLLVSDVASTGTLHKVTMTYSGSAITLSDNSQIADINFNNLDGFTPLNWLTDGTSCRYYGLSGVRLADTPYDNYYIDGSASLLVAPVTKIDSTFAKEGDLVTFAVRVWDYNHIIAGSLTLDYDISSLTYYNSTAHAELNGSFSSQVQIPGRLEMGWSGSSISLPDESVLVYITFTYLGGTIPLLWFDDGESCHFICGNLNLPLYDNPDFNYYINGRIAPSEIIWTGEGNNNDWNNPENWENSIVPDRFTHVTIDPVISRSIGPSFTGDFTMGTQCKNLTLIGDVQMTVTGDFTINPGHTFEMTGSGLIQIGGSWTNSGTFLPGSGTVDFIGSQDALISEGVPAGNYVAAMLITKFTAGMTPLTNANPGPSGDNEHSDVSIGFDFNYLGSNYSQVRISTNGWISFSFESNMENSSDNNALFDSRIPSNVLAPWWDDLMMDNNGLISYKTEGISPNRIFTVEWNNILAYKTGSTNRLNFQAKLFEATNVIEFCYGAANISTCNPIESASIGLKDAAGGAGNFLEATLNSTNIALPCLTCLNNWPEDNFRFSPPIENNQDIFYRLMVSKIDGKNLSLQRDVTVTGAN